MHFVKVFTLDAKNRFLGFLCNAALESVIEHTGQFREVNYVKYVYKDNIVTATFPLFLIFLTLCVCGNPLSTH